MKADIRLFMSIIIFCSPLWAAIVNADSALPKGIIALDPTEAPPLILNDLDGHTYDLQQARGKWVFVHFWASWCGPCKKEMKTIAAMAPVFRDTRLEIVLINTAEDEETVFTFLGQVAPDMNTLMDNDGLVTEGWKPRGLPSTYLVNPAGKIMYVVLGGRPWNDPAYQDFLLKLISATPPPGD